MNKKKGLLIGDDVLGSSGVGSVLREIIIGTSKEFDWVQIAVAINHPNLGKRIDLSEDTNKHAEISNSSVIQYPCNGYGNLHLIRDIMKNEKPDFVFLMTDPRYYVDFWATLEHEIRTKIPIIYYNVWDNLPYPHYNKHFYESCDALYCISKQTENVVKEVLGKNNKFISYIPHGINPKYFYPVSSSNPEYLTLQSLKQQVFEGKEYEFVGIVNNRNIRRKCIPDILVSWKMFIDQLPKEAQEKCFLILKTSIIDNAGTDLKAVCEMLFGYDKDKKYNVKIIDQGLPVQGMNLLYNIADFSINLSSAEGWGLSFTEALMVGKPVIATVTGGMQDQMRFEDENGNWVEFNEHFSSNHINKYQNHGEWAFPIFPSARTLLGSPSTPYIFEDYIKYEDVVKQLNILWGIKLANPKKYNDICIKAREWVLSNESKMNSVEMCKSVIENTNNLLKMWKPKEKYNLMKVESLQSSKHYHSYNIQINENY